MNREQRGILYGLALGDGHLTAPIKEKGKNSCLKIQHGIKQEEYIKHKANLLHSIYGGNKPNINYYERVHPQTNVNCKSVVINKATKYFTQMRRILYPKGKKTYTRKMLEYLTPHGLALWYMDDGTIEGRVSKKTGLISSITMKISTCCSFEEAKTIQKYFEDVWGITIKIHKQNRKNGKTYYNIAMNTKQSHRFASFIWPYIIPCMEYKMRFLEDFVLRTSARGPVKTGS